MKNPLLTVVVVSFVLLLFPATFQPVHADKPPGVHSEAVIVMDAATHEVLYEKNAHRTMYPASITKIITTILALENADLAEEVEVSFDAVNVTGSRVYLLEDEVLPLEQLLLGVMVSSGNDASIAVAEHLSGSVTEFADQMNQFVREKVGVENSHFKNPHGLFEAGHVTTAFDMAKISAYAMKNEQFREIVGTQMVEWEAEGWETTLYNHHELMRQNEEITGVKNGYVRKSGYTLVTSAEQDDTEVIVVTLNSNSRNQAFEDTSELLDYGLENYETQWLTFDDEELLLEHIYPEKMPVTTKKGEEIDYHVSEYGDVTITGENQRLVKEETLEERFLTNLPSYIIPDNQDEKLTKRSHQTGLWRWFIVSGFNHLTATKQ
ncbi:D-alanyl-D-alanine carboxypeptidase family protein [Alteribacter populi]|uniref:D-alanyl-D-alanine carboxypeptidase family protein n=1 Tax=Alteribacter populi TaxID=2011011 RepID=UPI000BBAAA0C|nr:D-alanyl-D-alanine carboxypeptidase family protein [Alteribacter populi]